MGKILKNFDYRILIGVLLVTGGTLGILEKYGLINNTSSIFWSVIFGFVGIIFFMIFFNNHEHLWSIIPGSAFVGLSISNILPDTYSPYNEFVFFSSVGLGFLFIYVDNHKNWWAIIPSGVLIDLGIVSAIASLEGSDTSAVFFLGLGATFLLVAILPNKVQRMNWAFIPSIIFLTFGSLFASAHQGWLDYIWISVLFCGGIFMVWRFLRTRNN